MVAAGGCAVQWEPARLTFPVEPSKPAVQHVRGHNSSTSDTYTYKVKATNPRRYSVRPSVGIVSPGQEAEFAVQLPAMKELPADMSKCKDKFQVLTLKLDAQTAAELQGMDEGSKAQRDALSEIWAADSAREAAVDKIKCAFTFDSSYRDVPIPEEEPNTMPYSPETVPSASGAAHAAVPPQTPYADVNTAADEPGNDASPPPTGLAEDSFLEEVRAGPGDAKAHNIFPI